MLAAGNLESQAVVSQAHWGQQYISGFNVLGLQHSLDLQWPTICHVSSQISSQILSFIFSPVCYDFCVAFALCIWVRASYRSGQVKPAAGN